MKSKKFNIPDPPKMPKMPRASNGPGLSAKALAGAAVLGAGALAAHHAYKKKQMKKTALVIDRTGSTGKKKGVKEPPRHGEREAFKKKFGDKGVSLARDEKGIFCYTHRCRSPSYPSVEAMSKKRVDFVDSTG